MNRSYADRARRALRGAAVVALSALALGACDDETAPPFEVEGTGTVSGLLYYDVNRDGMFEPIEGDSALVGIPVRLTVRGDSTQVISGSETVTDANGNFTITNVPIGTHDIVFEVEPGVAIVCNSPRPVSVRISEVTSVTISGQESCLVSIAAAREQELGSALTVRGVVTAGSGDLSSSYFFLQDETAGIKVFAPASAVVGQFMEISGELAIFSGELEIINPIINVLGTAPLPDPMVITGAELASHEFQGILATVNGLVVTEVIGPSSSGTDVKVTAPDGTNFTVRVDIDTGIPATSFAVGNTYNVTGVVSPFGGAEQLYVLYQTDIVPVP